MKLETLQKPESISTLLEKAERFAQSAKSDNTKATYRHFWNQFLEFAKRQDVEPLPASPKTVTAWLIELDSLGRKPATLDVALVAVSQAHKLAGFEMSPTTNPAVRETLKGIKVKRGTAQEGAKPLLISHLKRMFRSLPRNRLGKRDKALLLIGFAGALRRSELVALNVEDIEDDPKNRGIILNIRRSKTDQEGKGFQVGVPYGTSKETCPVLALRAWLEVAEIEQGSVFRGMDRHGNVKKRLTGRSVARIIKRIAQKTGLNPDDFSGHSLRSGLATEAADNGAAERMIMKQTGHKSEKTLRKYIRQGELFRENVCNGLL